MVVNKCRINNLAARNIRREASYQMVLIDLALIGAIKKEDAECLLGYKIPSYIQLTGKVKDVTAAAAVKEVKDAENTAADEDDKSKSFLDKLKGLQK